MKVRNTFNIDTEASKTIEALSVREGCTLRDIHTSDREGCKRRIEDEYTCKKNMDIEKNRVLIGVPKNPQIMHYINMDLEKGSENQKERLIVFLNILMQIGGGAITLKIINDDHTFYVCDIMLTFNGEWIAVTKEEMQAVYTTFTPDGEPVTLPDNIRIVDFNMLCLE